MQRHRDERVELAADARAARRRAAARACARAGARRGTSARARSDRAAAHTTNGATTRSTCHGRLRARAMRDGPREPAPRARRRRRAVAPRRRRRRSRRPRPGRRRGSSRRTGAREFASSTARPSSRLTARGAVCDAPASAGRREPSGMSAISREIAAARAQRRAAQRLDETQVEALFELPFNELLVHGAVGASAEFRSERRAGLDAAVDQDRRVPRGLRVLPAEHSFRDGRRHARLMPLDEVRAAAQRAKDAGATRFCMGASYRGPKDRAARADRRDDQGRQGARARDLRDARACCGRARPSALADAGLDYYNHNLDSSPEFYEKIISTRTYADRLETSRARARRRRQGLLRRHRRHGRDARRPRRLCCTRSRRSSRSPRACRSTSSCRYRARRSRPPRRSIRSSSCAASPSRGS